ncbi:MAG TPA: ABC transporter permease [Gemmatimonadales bacterium]|jgi:predicted permease|nr:ABC transporter permease [Gemmatimonadales bacterium]
MKRIFHWSRGPADAPEEVRREIELHLELRAREFEAQGMSPEAARRAALEAFGDRPAIEAEVRALRGTTLSERRRRDYAAELGQDFRLALRGLRRTPGFTLVALLTLSIGIGASTAMFSAVRSVLLRPLPYPGSDRLVQLWTDYRSKGRATPEWLTPPEFQDWQAATRAFSAMASYQAWGPNLTGGGDPENLTGAAVSGNFFSVLGTGPAAGRLFSAADDDANAERVVVLSDPLWRRRFGSDRGMIGRTIELNAEPWTVIGVLPADFRSPVPAEIWRPVRRPANSGCGRGCITVRAIGRMKPGVTFEQAKADLDGIAARLAREYPQTNEGVGAWPIPLHEQITGPTRAPLAAFFGAVLFVLLIGCVNLANLLLLRGAARAREISVRAALGAGRGRLVRQLVTESVVLAAAGGVLGLLLGWWGSRLLGALVPPGVREVQEIRVDGVVAAFAAGVSLLAGLLFGLTPALHGARADLMAALRTAGREGGSRGLALRNGLVVVELALAFMLLVGGGLLGQSFLKMQRSDLGFRTRELLTAAVVFPRARYPEPERAVVAILEVIERVRARPEVAAVAAVDQLPLLTGGDQDVDVTPVGEPLPGGKPFDIWYRSATPGYFRLIGMRLVAGREFTPADRAGAARVGVVNEEAARRMWPGKSPLGRELTSGGKSLTVVGMVGTARPDGPNQPVKAELFFPYAQLATRGAFLVVEPRHDLAAALGAVRAAVREVDPQVPLAAVATMEERIGEVVALPRLYALLVGIFGVAAVALAILGVYGVMAYAVALRHREIGVRLALGAAPGAIRRLVLGQGSRLAVFGLGLGLIGAAAVGRLLRTLLFGVGPLDAFTFGGVAILLGAMFLLACWLPARRAMRVDPLVAIRDE